MAQIFVNFLGHFENRINAIKEDPNDPIFVKNCCAYFWANLVKIGLIFSPTSGHAGSNNVTLSSASQY